MKPEQRKGIIQAAMHILESEAQRLDPDPITAITIAVNALPDEDQKNIAKRIVSYLKEQEMLLNQKQ
jgi:hypothetical protein